jgi:hypothetical protein
VNDRIRVIEHGIVLLDLSNIKNPDAELHNAEIARSLIASQPRGQALVLTDVTGSTFNEAAVDALKKLARHNKPFVKASALVGLSALTRIVFRAVTALTGRDIRVCSSREEAIAYLLTRRERDLPPLLPEE